MARHEKRMAPASAVAEELRRRIRSAVYRDREWLPSERELASELGMHRNSVRAAIEELGREGLLTIQPRCRAVVHNPQPAGRTSDAQANYIPGSRLIGLIMWSFDSVDGNTPQEQIFFGMSDVLNEAGYHGVFFNLGHRFDSSEENAIREAEYLTQALTRQFDGVVFYANAHDHNISLMREVAHRMPLVFIDRLPHGVEADFVGIDNFHAMHCLTNHAIDLGHKRIAYITGDEAINTIGDRLKGFRHALRDRFDNPPDAVLSGSSTSSSWSAFEAVFTAPKNKRPTALLCVNDVEARHAAIRLHEVGLSIPEDVSLTGFDNIIRNLPNGVELTSVEQPFRQIGRAAAELVLHRIDDPTILPSSIVCKTQVVLRASLSAPHE